MNNTAIVVIGAGIAGLSAAATLKSAGKEVIVLEASNRPGGRIVRMSRKGDFVEAGAQGIHTNYREMLKLADAYGLSPDLVVQRNRQAAYLDRQGSLRYPKGSYGITKLMDHRGTLDFFRFIARYMAMRKRFLLFETHRDIPSYDKVSAAEAFAWAGRDFKDFVLRPASHAMANIRQSIPTCITYST